MYFYSKPKVLSTYKQVKTSREKMHIPVQEIKSTTVKPISAEGIHNILFDNKDASHIHKHSAVPSPIILFTKFVYDIEIMVTSRR